MSALSLLAAALVASLASSVFKHYEEFWWLDEALHLFFTFSLTLVLALYGYGRVLTGSHRILLLLCIAGTPQHDHAPEKDDLGTVVHPQNVMPPDAPQDSRNKVWPTTESTTIDGRTYSLLVDRLDPNTPTIWLPGVDGRPGYEGRWGPRVTTDPNNRRAGMRFPEFWEMFFTALAKNLSK